SRAEQRDLTAFVRVIREDERQEVGLERAGAAADSIVSSSATADEVHSSALAAFNNGDSRAALRLFRRVVELEPRHQWAGHNLARAEQYARSAVDATSASLRNVSLDRVGLKEAAAVSSLGAFWDTLGWVYFREGNLPQAERYVRAAWLLNLNGEVGDHLAQIEEGLGRKDDAARTYALALAARRPLPDTRAHLAKLLGGDRQIDAMVERARSELVQLRSVPL